MGLELGLAALGHVVREGLGEQLIGRGRSSSQCPNSTVAPGVERGPGERAGQRGLAQPRLAGDQHDLAARRLRPPVAGVGPGGDRRRPTTPTSGRTARRAGSGTGAAAGAASVGSHSHLDRGDRLGQALQLEVAERPALVPAPAARHGGHDLRRQDLATVAPRAQSGRFDDRVAEVVVVLDTDLASTDPDPQPDASRSVRLASSTACCMATAQASAPRRREDDHQPVAEVLHLPSPGLGDGLAEDGEVVPSHVVGRSWADRRWDSSVEPTMSVNRIATFSVVIVVDPPPAPHHGRRRDAPRCRWAPQRLRG